MGASIRWSFCRSRRDLAPAPTEANCCSWRWLHAIATDLYREAAKRGIEIEALQVKVGGEFGGEGEPARNVTYWAWVEAKASEEEILDLMRFTDTVAEIHNTLRCSSHIALAECRARDTR